MVVAALLGLLLMLLSYFLVWWLLRTGTHHRILEENKHGRYWRYKSTVHLAKVLRAVLYTIYTSIY